MIIYKDLLFLKQIVRTLSKLVLSTTPEWAAGSHGLFTPIWRRKEQSMSSETRKGFGCFGLLVLLGLGLAAFVVLHHNYDVDNFTKGHQAYLQLDCAKALDYYDKLDSWILFTYGDYLTNAHPEEMECIWLLGGVNQQQANDLSGAVFTYNSFVTKHAASPLVGLAQTKVASIFTEIKPADFFTEELCKQIDQFVTNDLVPQPDTNLPPVYFACGQLYEKSGIYPFGIDYYEKFLSAYPGHTLVPEVKSALLRAIVARAKLGGGGSLPTPERSGTTEDGLTLVIIRNESPESLRIVFSGIEDRIEELEACSTCTTFISNPSFCPGAGPVGRYTLKPGQYFVVVESTSSPSTSPWSGDWVLEGGAEYTNCFFIIKTYKFGN